MDNDDKEKILQELSDISNIFIKAMKEIEEEEEKYWNSLSKDDQLKAFCAVCRRIHKAEIEDKGTYRYALYNVFEFGPEAYAAAQMAGYLDIHNSIFDIETEQRLLKEFAKFHKLGEDAVTKFYSETR
jgi:hypothetical protein